MEKNFTEDSLFSIEPTADIYIYRDTKYFGPFSEEEIKNLLEEGLLNLSHHYWRKEMPEWVSLGDYEFFRSHAGEPLNINDEFFAKHTRVDQTLTEEQFQKVQASESSIDRILNNLEKDYFADFKMEDFVEPKETKFKIDAQGVTIPFNKITQQIAVGVTAVIVITIAISQLFKDPVVDLSLLQKVDYNLRAPLKETIAMSASDQDVKVKAELVSKYSREPEFVFATNAKKGVKLRVRVTGVKETLVANQNFIYDEDFVVTNQLMTTGRLRQIDGRFVAMGDYKITVDCESCNELDNPTVYTASFFVGGRKDNNYEEQLKIHHYNLRKKANDEIDELNMIVSAVSEQIELNKVKYIRYRDQSSDLAYKRWREFTQVWTQTQSSIISAFNEMDNKYFVSELIYKDLYKQMRLLSIQLMDLHQLNDKIVISKSQFKAKRPEAMQEYQSIVKQMASIKRAIDKKKKLLTQSKGYPRTSTKG